MRPEQRADLERKHPRLNIDRILEAWEMIRFGSPSLKFEDFLKRADQVVENSPTHGWARKN